MVQKGKAIAGHAIGQGRLNVFIIIWHGSGQVTDLSLCQYVFLFSGIFKKEKKLHLYVLELLEN